MRLLFLKSHPLWAHGLPNGFRDLGCQVELAGTNSAQALAEQIERFQPNMIWGIGWTPEFEKTESQALLRRLIRQSGAGYLYWATEDPGYAERFTIPFIKGTAPDLVFTICPAMIERYQSLGFTAAPLEFGYHPRVHFPAVPQEHYRSPAALVAHSYWPLYHRNPGLFRFRSMHTLIDPLLDAGIRIDFYGRFWDRMRSIFATAVPDDWIRGWLPYTEANQVYSSAGIIIGLQNIPEQLTQRTFEILGSGGLLLTLDTPAVRRLFEPDRDLLVSNDPDRTLRLVRHFLEHPEECRRMAEQGRCAVAPHSYRYRAEYVLTVLAQHGIAGL